MLLLLFSAAIMRLLRSMCSILYSLKVKACFEYTAKPAGYNPSICKYLVPLQMTSFLSARLEVLHKEQENKTAMAQTGPCILVYGIKSYLLSSLSSGGCCTRGKHSPFGPHLNFPEQMVWGRMSWKRIPWLPQPFPPPSLSLNGSVESWFCGCGVVGGGWWLWKSDGRSPVLRGNCQFMLFAPGLLLPSGLEHFSCVPMAGLGRSETWALLVVAALMLADPTTQSKSLHI